MFNFRNFFLVTLVLLLLTGYYAKVQREELGHQRQIVKEKIEKIQDLKEENATLAGILDQKIADVARVTSEYEKYKSDIAKIDLTPQVKIIFRDRIKEVPAEIVTEEANESSNEIIDRINTRAIAFTSTSVRNEN